MSTDTKPRVLKGIFEVLKGLGNSDTIDYSDEKIIMLHPALVEALSKWDNGKIKKEVEKPVNVTSGSNKGKGKSGIRKEYEAPTVSAEEMTPAKLEEMKKILEGSDYERGK